MKKSLYGFMFLFFLIQETWAMWEGEDPEDNLLGRTTSKQNNKIEKENILEESAEENRILYSETEALAVLREKKENFLTLAKNEIKMVKTRNPYYSYNRYTYYNYSPCYNPYMEVETKGVNYEKYLKAAREINDVLIEKEDPEAINWKILGLEYGKNSYEKNFGELVKFNDFLVKQGNIEAVKRKIEWLIEEKHGYSEEYSEELRVLNDFLVEREDLAAIKRKMLGLVHGKYSEIVLLFGYCGYEKNLEVARDFGDELIKKGNIKAIQRKIKGLMEWTGGKYGYKQNHKTLREFIEILIKEGHEESINQIIKKNKVLRTSTIKRARMLNDILVEQGDLEAIKRKIIGLMEGKYGYTTNSEGVRKFIDLAIVKDNLNNIKTFKQKIKTFKNKQDYDEEHSKLLKILNNYLIERSIPISLLQSSPDILVGEDPAELLPFEILINVCIFLDVSDLGRLAQVSSKWKEILDTDDLWKIIGLVKYKNYLSQEELKENPRQKVLQHFLRILVNTKEDTKEIERIVQSYGLNLYIPSFKEYIDLRNLIPLIENPSDHKILIAQNNKQFIGKQWKVNQGRSSKKKIWQLGAKSYVAAYELKPEIAKSFIEVLARKADKEAILLKIEGLIEGKNGYKKNLQEARNFNEFLVEQGNSAAITRKREGLKYGKHGYEVNLETSKEFNEFLIKKGSESFRSMAIWQKILGLMEGKDGYEENPQAARELNDILCEQGDFEAIGRKITGLADGKYGYEVNPEALGKTMQLARVLNDALCEQGDIDAIWRKGVGLERGRYGYEIDLGMLRAFNENLIEKGDKKAIERKREGLIEGEYGYEKSPQAWKEFNEKADQGDKKALWEKMLCISYGSQGYEKNLQLAREINEGLIQKGSVKAMSLKIDGLLIGCTYIYEKNLEAARTFNELLIEKDIPGAIWRKIWGLVIGSYGYEKSLPAAKEFIQDLAISKNRMSSIIGCYIISFCQKYGISRLGYNKDHEEAIRFIKKHHIPY